MEIVKFPHPSLLTPCKPVAVFGPELLTILDSMYETMVKHNGLGLSANQVGLDMAMFVIGRPEGGKLNIINPKILAISKKIVDFKEGCLSSPGTFVSTGNRPEWVQLEFDDPRGFVHRVVFKDIDAIIVSHECEHLQGKSFLQSKSIPKNIRTKLCKKWGLK